MRTGNRLWLGSKHSKSSTSCNSDRLHDRNRGMLRRRVHIPERRRCLRSNASRRRILISLVRNIREKVLRRVKADFRCRYIMMWPWRVQTINGATGSAFAIAFANSYGQIGGAVGAQLFNSRFAPRYETSFAIAMGFVGIAITVASITWYFTGSVDIEMRRERRARIAASKQE